MIDTDDPYIVPMSPDVMRALGWRIRCHGGFAAPHPNLPGEWAITTDPAMAFVLDGHDAAVSLALDMMSAFDGVIVEPVPNKEPAL